MSVFSSQRKDKQEPGFDESDLPRFEDGATEELPAKRTRTRRKPGAQGGQPLDPILPEKKRARRRLVGVIALVLAAVIGLPMILDVEPKPLAEDISVHIPSRDKSLKSDNPAVPVRAPAETAASLDPKEEVIQPSAAVPTPGNPADHRPAVAAGMNGQGSADKGSGQSERPAQSAEKAAQQGTAKGDGRALAKAAEKDDEKARAKALLDNRSSPAINPQDKKSGKFVIQVAAFATKEKVSELQGKLKDAGIRSYTEKVSTDNGGKIRVRIGPFATREEVDRMRTRLEKLGLGSTLVSA